MKGETLFRALGDIGDDLLHMAATKKFVNPWKKWASLAACLALVICLGTLVLPYFPMGCGSAGSPQEPEMEAPAETESMTPTAPESGEESVEMEAPEKTPMPEPDSGEGVEETWVVYGSTYYYLNGTVFYEKPENLGEKLGVVEDSTGGGLVDCPVYAVAYCTWYSNHAVDGVAVPNMIYVYDGEKYYYGMTYNEKTVSRYTAEDVQKAIEEENAGFLLETFVWPWEAYEVGTMADGALEQEQLDKLFLASLQMNTGTTAGDQWRTEDGTLVVPRAAVVWRLERFLDAPRYDKHKKQAVFRADEQYREAPELTLEAAVLEENVLRLTVNGGRVYTIRLDADSWRYLEVQ